MFSFLSNASPSPFLSPSCCFIGHLRSGYFEKPICCCGLKCFLSTPLSPVHCCFNVLTKHLPEVSLGGTIQSSSSSSSLSLQHRTACFVPSPEATIDGVMGGVSLMGVVPSDLTAKFLKSNRRPAVSIFSLVLVSTALHTSFTESCQESSFGSEHPSLSHAVRNSPSSDTHWVSLILLVRASTWIRSILSRIPSRASKRLILFRSLTAKSPASSLPSPLSIKPPSTRTAMSYEVKSLAHS
mmetsp:Transcript_19787/g.46448  ORF Transcript_19787/g.46448 Transcript_19787/m.46448 type:complete len:240 (-) Transcript_19787:845-1564(-)